MGEKKPLFGKNIPPACEYCAHGRRTQGGLSIFCENADDSVSAYDHCESFKYDPLKRVPKRAPKMPVFSADDFKL